MSHMNLLESEAACLIFLANREFSLERLRRPVIRDKWSMPQPAVSAERKNAPPL
ncbi:MAG: hypothetical protein JOZ32_15960 [Bryobacterales bacterium]|nr:hypothetical protein [Bryobacterales bacterium]